MSNINKAAVLNPFTDLTANTLDYVPRATTSEFGIVAIGSGINVDALGRIYLDTQEYSDRLTAIEAQAASSLTTQQSEVAAAIAQVNLTQSQAITALTLEVNNLQTNLTDSITATQTELINRADQLAQDVTDITVQLTQDKATFTQEIQDALDSLQDEASVASALRTPRKINGTDFDGSSDITTDTWGATRTFKIGNKTNSINGTSNVDYSLADIGAFPEVGGTIQGNVEVTGNLSVIGTISATFEGTAASADKLYVARKIQGVDFDGTQDINLPTFTAETDGLVPKRVGTTADNYLREDGTWVVPTDTTYALLTKIAAEEGTATDANTISAQVLKEAIQYHAPTVTNIVGNAATTTKLQTARSIAISGAVTGTSTSFDGSSDIAIATTEIDGSKISTGTIPAERIPTLNQNTTGNASTASKLGTARSVTFSGGATGSYNFDGSTDVVCELTVAPSVVSSIDASAITTGTLNAARIPTLNQNTSGNAATAGKLANPVQIHGVNFDGSTGFDIPNFTASNSGVVPAAGADTTKYLRSDGTWQVPTNTTYPTITSAEVNTGTDTTGKLVTAALLKQAVTTHTPLVTNITGNAGTATKLQTPRTINGVLFDGTQNISLPEAVAYSLPTASNSVLGGIKVGSGLAISNSVLSVDTLNQSTTGNAATATKLQTARTISLTGKVTGSVSFDGSANASITTAITGLGAANGIATLDSNGQVPSTQLPSFVDDVLEYVNLAAFPTTGVAGKIYVETTGNTTYRWGGTAYVKITSGEVSSVAGKTGVITLSKADVGLSNVDNTADSSKSVASATKLTTARTIGGVSFDGSANINLPGVNTAGNQNTTGNAASATNCSRSVIAGNGLSGGGALTSDPTVTLGTPGNITATSTNSVTGTSHTHNLDVNSLPFLGTGSNKSKSIISDTTYTNTGNRPIFVTCSMSGSGSNAASATLAGRQIFSTNSSNQYSQSFVVGVGVSYSFTGNNLVCEEYS